MGASGGPKWFILSHLDRFLFGDFLFNSEKPITTLGSSIGAWRNACFGTANPAAAIARLEHGYLHQYYESRPTPAEVSEVSLGTLRDTLGATGVAEIIGNQRVSTHIVTARGRGATGSSSTPVLATGMGVAALGNTISRKMLRHAFQRVVYHSGQVPDGQLALHDFQTHYVPLQSDNLAPALHASGAIPFVLTGERNIPGGPAGKYWDGGIIDYHFDLGQYRGDGLILYPHFSDSVIHGWFDKFLPWRKASIADFDNLVLLCPSPELVADLPQGKIPDRGDFTRMDHEDRVRYWTTCVERNKAMADEFAAQIAGNNPLEGVTVLGDGALS